MAGPYCLLFIIYISLIVIARPLPAFKLETVGIFASTRLVIYYFCVDPAALPSPSTDVIYGPQEDSDYISTAPSGRISQSYFFGHAPCCGEVAPSAMKRECEISPMLLWVHKCIFIILLNRTFPGPGVVYIVTELSNTSSFTANFVLNSTRLISRLQTMLQ